MMTEKSSATSKTSPHTAIKNKNAAPAKQRREDRTIAIWLGLLAVACAAMTVILAAAFHGQGVNDARRHTPTAQVTPELAAAIEDLRPVLDEDTPPRGVNPDLWHRSAYRLGWAEAGIQRLREAYDRRPQ